MTARGEVEVTQADQKAALCVITGDWNKHVFAQAFARHRIAHTKDAAQLAQLEAALEPFAKMGRMLVGTFGLALFRDDQPIGLGAAWKENGETRTITFGDLRTAAKALARIRDTL
jgi:hypothetical protein